MNSTQKSISKCVDTSNIEPDYTVAIKKSTEIRDENNFLIGAETLSSHDVSWSDITDVALTCQHRNDTVGPWLSESPLSGLSIIWMLFWILKSQRQFNFLQTNKPME